MSQWLIGIVTVFYLAVAVDQLRKGSYGLALTFFGYSVANVGLIMGTK